MTSRVYWILKIVNKQSFLILIYVDKISSYDTEQYVFQTMMNAILWFLATGIYTCIPVYILLTRDKLILNSLHS